MKVLLTGVTGYIGSRLLPKLIAEGHKVSCMVRDLSRVESTRFEAADWVYGDALDMKSLETAFDGIEAAYYLIHSMNSGSEFERRDRTAAQNFATQAKRAGVKRLIYLGGLGSSGPELSKHLKSRQDTGRILREFGPPVTEFRAAVIVGSGSVSFEMIRYLTERLPVMICPQWVTTRCQPIAIRDVLSYLSAALKVNDSANQIVEIGGADIHTYESMMLIYAELRGLKRLLIRVPVLTPRLSSYWVDLVTPIPSSISRPLIEGLKSEVICHDTLAKTLFPGIQFLEYREAVRLALGRLNSGELESIWSGSLSSTESRTPPPALLKTTEGMIIDARESPVKAPVSVVFRVVSRVGGKQGWFYGNVLWRLRAIFDRMIGGVGMRRGRRDPNVLRPGEPVDFWRVEAVETDRLLRLHAEMKLPGKAWLQFEIIEKPDGATRLRSTAFFEPRGLAGQIYWWVLYPIHVKIFNGINRNIALAAEREARALTEPADNKSL